MRTVAAVAIVLALAGCGDKADERDEAEETLRAYLSAVSGGDYEGAAELLVVGDEPLGQRADLAPLEVEALTTDAVADGLARYCAAGCPEPTGMTLVPDGDGFVATVAFGEPRGHPLNRSLHVGTTPDGRPYVRGLPPAGEGTLPVMG